MNEMLNQAIGALNLQPGDIFRTIVNGHEIEVRALPASGPAPTNSDDDSEFENMVMLQPWFSLPYGPTVATVRAKPGPPRLPDPPIIPRDDEDL